MTRKHRIAHRVLWPILALALIFGVTMALYLRPPASAEPAAAAENQQ